MTEDTPKRDIGRAAKILIRISLTIATICFLFSIFSIHIENYFPDQKANYILWCTPYKQYFPNGMLACFVLFLFGWIIILLDKKRMKDDWIRFYFIHTGATFFIFFMGAVTDTSPPYLSPCNGEWVEEPPATHQRQTSIPSYDSQ